MSGMERLQRMFAGAGGALGHPPPDSPTLDSSEQVYISSLALLKMLKHGSLSLSISLFLSWFFLVHFLYLFIDFRWFKVSLRFSIGMAELGFSFTSMRKIFFFRRCVESDRLFSDSKP